ncbi:transmembrane protein fend-like isoform X2 [Anopheles stephensi]|uniref:transmembrane protein fend-like isoform X2 n=1 Tax=Anopheles stephensi TaxID=30069 RepID=UPI001658739E|nr:transmembrane protein fend-like isoform X2 [Anopheles stephensi]
MVPVGDTRWLRLGLSLLTVTLVGWVVEATVPTDSYQLTGSSSIGASTVSAKETVSTSTSSTSTNTTINRCREVCLTKHSIPDMACSQTQACSTCLSSCAYPGDSSPMPSSHRTSPLRCKLELTVHRMVRNESLVTADVSWSATVSDICNDTNFRLPGSSQCLVTWEVSGGGLMGNLLTESSSVQLSLWSDTNYSIQVTCRSKHSSSLERSAPLVLSTSRAIMLKSSRKSIISDVTASTVQLLSEIAEGDDDEALARALDSSEELDRNGHRSRLSGRLHPWPIARESESEIAILALFVAMLLFLLVLLTIVIMVKWRPSPDEPDRLEKDVLVENDAMFEILHV